MPDSPDRKDSSGELLQFPTSFPIKIMGKQVDGFAQAIADLVLLHAPDFDPATMEFRNSKEGNYLGLTATINATSKLQLDELYLALTKHPMVKIVL
jgi:uncharacterized protein